MSTCIVCGNECGDKAKTCSDKCRKAASRGVTLPVDASVTNRCDITSVTSGCDKPSVTYATRTNPDQLNYGEPLTKAGLAKARLRANRVPIPGDYDYKGVCQQISGAWAIA